VTRAAAVGVPSIVAIQRCAEPVCYGLMSDHDHKNLPVFGDPDPSLAEVPLEAVVRKLTAASDAELRAIGEACRLAAAVYGEEATLRALDAALGSAKRTEHHDMGLRSLSRIRVETWMSRLRGRSTIDG
jgi:hypothetical protein